jgi:hypothetical protein
MATISSDAASLISQFESKWQPLVQLLVSQIARTTAGASKSHGTEHVLRVCLAAVRGVSADSRMAVATPLGRNLTIYLTILTTMLHDVDDRKYLVQGVGSNVTRILAEIQSECGKYIDPSICDLPTSLNPIETLRDNISCFGTSGKGANAFTDPNVPWWVRIAIAADRLESVGYQGVMRTIAYSEETQRSHHETFFSDKDIPRFTDIADLRQKSKAAFAQYSSGVEVIYNGSTIGHIFTKIYPMGLDLSEQIRGTSEYMANYIAEAADTQKMEQLLQRYDQCRTSGALGAPGAQFDIQAEIAAIWKK